MEEEKVEKLPNLKNIHMKFLLTLPESVVSSKEKAEIKEKLMSVIKADNMAPFYVHVCEELKWQIDNDLLAKMSKENEEKLQKLESNLKDAMENLGESEVRDAINAKAEFFTRIGDKTKAEQQFKLTLEQTVGAGPKLDVVFCMIRLGLFWKDSDMVTRNLEKARSLMEAGSDWDRKNRVKVYEALHLMSIRNFKAAALLLLDTLSTFSAVEIIDFEEFIFYLIVTCAVSVDRPTIKEKILHAPEVLSVIEKIPHLQSLLNSLYYCRYGEFLVSLAGITEALKRDYFASAHAAFYCKEMRIIAYKQLLESYKSMELSKMANSFDVSVEFIDHELSRFIANGRIHAKIDKVSGIIETTRPDSKNAQYSQVIKQGDALLNRVQKLATIINL